MQHPQFKFEFMQLTELKDKESFDILMLFLSQTNKFTNTIQNQLKPDINVLFVHCLAKMCDATFDESKLKLLNAVCQSPFMENFQKYIMALPYMQTTERKDNPLYWNDPQEFWSNVFKFFNSVMEDSPDTAYKCLTELIDIIKFVLDGLKERQNENFPESLLNAFETMRLKFKVLSEEQVCNMSL
jgi:hypothetical protein